MAGRPLVEQIRREINSGKLVPGRLIGSEYALARDVGISRNTVRRAIGQLVDEGLVERRPGKGVFVRDKHVQTRSICMMVADLGYSTWALFAQAVQKYGRERGLSISVFDIHREIDNDLGVLDHIPMEEFQGAIITFLADKRVMEAIYRMRLARTPFAVIGGGSFDPDIMSVGNDNFGDGRQVGQQLVALGHRRIGYLGVPDVIDRCHGLRAAMDEAGIHFDSRLAINMGPLILGSDWTGAVEQAVDEILSVGELPTAIFASDDGVAAHVVSFLRRRGLSVPDDISVVGFGGESLGRFVDPSLATVQLPTEEIARVAVDMVVHRMVDPECPGERKDMLGTWVPRDSAAVPQG